jgi:hypothetical protein
MGRAVGQSNQAAIGRTHERLFFHECWSWCRCRWCRWGGAGVRPCLLVPVSVVPVSGLAFCPLGARCRCQALPFAPCWCRCQALPFAPSWHGAGVGGAGGCRCQALPFAPSWHGAGVGGAGGCRCQALPFAPSRRSLAVSVVPVSDLAFCPLPAQPDRMARPMRIEFPGAVHPSRHRRR